MKNNLISIIFVCLVFLGNAQETKITRIDPEYFQNLAKYDTLDFYIVSDKAQIYFDYSDRYLGAVDENFDLGLKRNLRFKVNSLSKLTDNKLIIFKLRDSISYDHIKFDKIKIYSLDQGIVVKNTVKPKSIYIYREAYTYIVDLKKIGASPGCIIEISYFIKDLDRQILSWKFDPKYFTLIASFEAVIPEIYNYDEKKIGDVEINFDHKTYTIQGDFLGYYMPKETLKYKLVTPTYYKLVKQKGRDVSDAKKVYCKNVIHYFEINKMYPNNHGVPNGQIIFNLRTIGSILF